MLTKFEAEYYSDDKDNQHISGKGYENYPKSVLFVLTFYCNFLK